MILKCGTGLSVRIITSTAKREVSLSPLRITGKSKLINASRRKGWSPLKSLSWTRTVILRFTCGCFVRFSEPIDNYEAAVISGKMLYISGQLPLSDGKLVYQGQVGSELTVSEGYRAAELAAVNVLAQIKKKVGGLDRLVRIVRVDGHISSSDDFIDHPKVLDGASDLFKKSLG